MPLIIHIFSNVFMLPLEDNNNDLSRKTPSSQFYRLFGNIQFNTSFYVHHNCQLTYFYHTVSLLFTLSQYSLFCHTHSVKYCRDDYTIIILFFFVYGQFRTKQSNNNWTLILPIFLYSIPCFAAFLFFPTSSLWHSFSLRTK